MFASATQGGHNKTMWRSVECQPPPHHIKVDIGEHQVHRCKFSRTAPYLVFPSILFFHINRLLDCLSDLHSEYVPDHF